MKIKVIAKNEKDEKVNIFLTKENKLYVKDSIIEIDERRAKELLKIRYNDKPIVELVKKISNSEEKKKK